MSLFLADVILVLHVAFILFVVLGQVLILVGLWRRWRWIRNPLFRITHLLAIGFVVAEAWLGITCPLTAWENRLRLAAGEAIYEAGFIASGLQRLIFYTAPGWVFTLLYTAFFAVVLACWIAAPPRRRP